MRAVLFDLDGTLLDVDGDAVLEAYVAALGRRLAPAMDPEAFRALVMAAALPMLAAQGGQTTLGVRFQAALAPRLGLPPEAVARSLREIDGDFDQEVGVGHAPWPAAQAAVRGLLDAGLPLAVATTPIYGEAAIRSRLDWARLGDVPWSLITHSDNMHACKPDAAYFREAAGLLGLEPRDCLMVGDDPWQDGAAAEAGMAFLRVGQAPWDAEDPWTALARLVDGGTP